jgi:glycosyltransferase involved in cell wall biosynthesis
MKEEIFERLMNTSRKYRILHVLPDMRMGGGQILLIRNLPKMDSSRFEHVVCYLEPNFEMVPSFQEIGVNPICLHHRGDKDFRTVYRLVELMRREKIDLVHTNNTPLDKTYGQWAALLARIPVVNTLHGMGSQTLEPLKERAFVPNSPALARRKIHTAAQSLLDGRFVEKFNHRASCTLDRWRARWSIKHLIAVSDAVRRSWGWFQHDLHLPHDQVSIVYAGLDVQQVMEETPPETVAALRKELDLEDAHPLLVNVARLVPEKGQKYLIPMMKKIVKQYPKAKLIVIGDGPLEDEVQEQINQAGLQEHIKLLGTRMESSALMAMGDIFVLPSLSEGFGLVVQEAMALGKPVVAFGIPPLREFVADNVSGFLVGVEDSAAMAEKVLHLLANPDLMQEMGQAGQRIVQEKFTSETTVRNIERVYLAVLENDGKALNRSKNGVAPTFEPLCAS